VEKKTAGLRVYGQNLENQDLHRPPGEKRIREGREKCMDMVRQNSVSVWLYSVRQQGEVLAIRRGKGGGNREGRLRESCSR